MTSLSLKQRVIEEHGIEPCATPFGEWFIQEDWRRGNIPSMANRIERWYLQKGHECQTIEEFIIRRMHWLAYVDDFGYTSYYVILRRWAEWSQAREMEGPF